jgi:hypothetical protein
MREFKPGILEFRNYAKTDIEAVYAEFRYRSTVVNHYKRRLGNPWNDSERALLQDTLNECIVWYEGCKWDLDRLVEDRYDGTIPASVLEKY